MTTFLAILTGGGLTAIGVVLAALAANWLGARRDKRRYEHEQAMAAQAQRHEQAMAKQAQDHERAMAAETRRQERMEQAYIELLQYLSRQWRWARSVRPPWGQTEAPGPLPDEEHWRNEALVTAYGSFEVACLIAEWGDRAKKLEDADEAIRMVEESPNPSRQVDEEARQEMKAIPAYREALLEADKAIRDRVRQELAGEV
jgi:type II secretory pathway pseudopilin PulG